jgi:hypothetical protein
MSTYLSKPIWSMAAARASGSPWGSACYRTGGAAPTGLRCHPLRLCGPHGVPHQHVLCLGDQPLGQALAQGLVVHGWIEMGIHVDLSGSHLCCHTCSLSCRLANSLLTPERRMASHLACGRNWQGIHAFSSHELMTRCHLVKNNTMILKSSQGYPLAYDMWHNGTAA